MRPPPRGGATPRPAGPRRPWRVPVEEHRGQPEQAKQPAARRPRPRLSESRERWRERRQVARVDRRPPDLAEVTDRFMELNREQPELVPTIRHEHLGADERRARPARYSCHARCELGWRRDSTLSSVACWTGSPRNYGRR